MSETPGYSFWIHVTPGSRRSGGDALRVAVRAASEGGKANAACGKALAEAFGVARAQVELDTGSKRRGKRVHIHGEPTKLERRFCELAASR